MITLTIDGREVKLEKPTTVLEAARQVGIKIPTLCYHPLLEKYGGCRLCLVEVERMPRLQTACTLLTADGMIVRTETEQIASVRRGILEFLLINHPLDCPYCDKAGECELQDLVEKYGAAKGRYHEKKRKVPEALEDPVIVRNMERCVMCTRCVRMCEGVQGRSAIAVINRGGHSHIEPFSGGKFDCEYCGNCVSVCPVGAIMSRLHRHSYRPWQVKEKTESICPYCGVGCTVVIQTRDDVIKRVIPKIGSAVNNGMLCSRGRFGYEFVGSEDRLTAPLIKRNGVLEKATWEEAISFVGQRLREIREKHGPAAIGGIASPRCTNEDNYVFQKFFRRVIGTNNIDSTARTGYAGAQTFLENIFGQGVTGNIISGIANSDLVFVMGGDPTTVNPILGLQIRACSRRGGTLLTVGRIPGLKHFSPVTALPKRSTETLFLEALVTALKEKKGLPGSNAELEAVIQTIAVPASEAETTCGVGTDELARFVEQISSATTPSVIIGKDVVQASGGSYALLLLAAVSYLINGRIFLLSERANEQGVIDMGCAPDLLPGGRPISLDQFRSRVETAWKAPVPETAGLNLYDMIKAAGTTIKALYIMGENAVANIPDRAAVAKALSSLEFLVVQDIFLTETAKLADVVLPALGWAEKDGSFTNMERRIQRLRRAVVREGMADWKIIAEVAGTMGTPFDHENAEEIFHEISTVSPLHRDLTYVDLKGTGAIYPYKGEPLRDVREPIQFDRGNGTRPAEALALCIERPLFHSGTLSTHAASLVKIYPQTVAMMNPETARKASLGAGDVVNVTSGRGTLQIPVALNAEVDPATVVISNNFESDGAFAIAAYTVEPVLKSVCLDGNIVTIEKVSR